MNEEEIIEEVKKELKLAKNIDDVATTIRNEYIEGLLGLYNKEKEKNKELLEGLKYRVDYCKLLEKELYSNGINYTMELTKIEQKYLQELLGDDN